MAQYGRVAKAGVLWDYCRSALDELISIPTGMVLARLLAPVEFGIWAASAFFVQLAARLMNFGFNTALVQIKECRPEHASSVFVVNLVMGVGLWAALAATAPWLGAFFRSPETARVIPIAGLSFMIASLGTVSNAIMNRNLQFRVSTYTGWVKTGTQSATTLLLAWFGFSYWSLVYGELVSSVAQTIALLILVGWRPSLKFSWGAIRDVFSFGMGLHAKRLLDYAALNLDNLVVGRTLGMASLGFYEKAFSTMNRLVSRLNLGGASISFRIFAIIHEEPERFCRAYRKVLLSVTIINYPILAGVMVAAPQIITVLFGEPWLPAALPFQILCAAGMLKLLNQYASSAIQAKGRVWSEVVRQLIYAVLLVAAVVAFSLRWGLAGAAWGVMIATTAMTFLMHSMLKRATNLSWGDLLWPQVPALLCSAGVVSVLIGTAGLARAWLGQPAAWQLLAAQTVAGTLFYVIFLRFSRFDEIRALVHETLVDFAPSLAHVVKSST